MCEITEIPKATTTLGMSLFCVGGFPMVYHAVPNEALNRTYQIGYLPSILHQSLPVAAALNMGLDVNWIFARNLQSLKHWGSQHPAVNWTTIIMIVQR